MEIENLRKVINLEQKVSQSFGNLASSHSADDLNTTIADMANLRAAIVAARVDWPQFFLGIPPYAIAAEWQMNLDNLDDIVVFLNKMQANLELLDMSYNHDYLLFVEESYLQGADIHISCLET